MKLKSSKVTTKKKAPVKKSAPKKTNKKMEQGLSLNDYEHLAQEYTNISEQMKQLDNRKKELAKLLKEGAERLGNTDAKGSSYAQTDNFLIGRVCRTSYKINDEKGYNFFQNYKDEDGKKLTECIQQVTKFVVDEEAVAKAVNENRIDVNIVRSNVYDESRSFSVLVKPIEEMKEEDMPEVEVSKLSK